ncbi:MAG TPA: YitT family protein [Saprospiraceae bacterium]|nr:YitT family protein [Saprospiraceae bacterium]HQW25097.1 YitT family protein [Saprospiraceae bacterium]
MSHTDTIDWKGIFSIQSVLFTMGAVLCMTFALKGFLLPKGFLDGGVTGISILLYKKLEVPVGISLILFNIPFVVVGYKKIGKSFAVQTTFAIILLNLCFYLIPFQGIETEDKLLVALFGGFFVGLAIGLAIKGGGVLDGMEVVADYTHKKSGFSTSEIVMLFNTTLFIIAAIFLSTEQAMYSIVTYFTAMKISDYVVDGFEEYTALSVISGKHDMIKGIIVNDFNKAISVYKGERGYLPTSFDVKHDTDIVMTIVTRLEIHRMRLAILEADPNAFIFIQSIKEVTGGIIKRKVKH